MCAAVEAAVKNPTGPADSNAGKMEDDMVTASFEAAQLFNDDGRPREFAPSAIARAMPGLLEQRKAREYCDVVFRAPDGGEIWAHRFVMCHKFSGCYTLFVVARESMTPEEKQGVWTRPIRAVINDLEGDMIELLVDFAYQTSLYERVGTHNIAKVLELAVTMKIFPIRDHCLRSLKQNLEPENCVDTYHMAVSYGYDNLAREAFRYLLRNYDQVWKNSAQFEALTPEEMRAVLEDNRLHALSEVEDTFRSILKWISADGGARKMYLAKFLPLVRFVRCTVIDFEKVIISPEVQGDGDSLKVLNVIHQTLTRHSMAVGQVAGIDLSPKLWLTPRLPKDILFLFGGWTSGATNHMQTYNCRAEKWRFLGRQYTPPRAYHGVAVVNECIYVVGGFNGRECYHSVVCFDVPLARWTSKANMAYPRCYVSVAVLQGYIYAMGGFTGELRTSTVERYDVKNDRWSMVASMMEERSDASAGAACGRIYM
ncbi:kelch-like protein 10 [Rhipicephalus sanguineus]|uniref:kelch-like protein 10 n=1 Tax=Rhipicephalus sanguineus TaxID=34632 RepID=UPI0020C23475|nr:kelch-like protein 10 [Rhipicephalus sanguineus]